MKATTKDMSGFEVTAHIYETTNYELFKKLNGNREINGRSNKVKKSIEEIGNLNVPILINENWEIIEGQARYTACKELGIPVKFTVEPKAGIKECQILNVNSTNWSTKDFVISAAKQGVYGAIIMLNLMETFKKLPMECVFNELNFNTKTGLYDTRASHGGNLNSFLRGNRFDIFDNFDDERYYSAREALAYATSFYDVMERNGIRRDRDFYNAILFVYRNHKIDNKKFYVSLDKFSGEILKAKEEAQYLRQFEQIYNKSRKSEVRMSLRADFEISHGLKKPIPNGG